MCWKVVIYSYLVQRLYSIDSYRGCILLTRTEAVFYLTRTEAVFYWLVQMLFFYWLVQRLYSIDSYRGCILLTRYWLVQRLYSIDSHSDLLPEYWPRKNSSKRSGPPRRTSMAVYISRNTSPPCWGPATTSSIQVLKGRGRREGGGVKVHILYETLRYVFTLSVN